MRWKGGELEMKILIIVLRESNVYGKGNNNVSKSNFKLTARSFIYINY